MFGAQPATTTDQPVSMKKETKVSTGQLRFGNLVEDYHNPFFTKATIAVISLAVVGFLIWAALSPIHEIVVAEGKIQPDGFVHKVQHLEGGIVSEIVVREGDIVRKGDVLARLTSVRLLAELEKAEATLQSMELAVVRNNAFAFGKVGELAGNAQRPDLVESQRSALDEDGAYRDARLATLDGETSRLQVELSGTRARLDKSLEELDILKKRLADYEAAFRRGAVSKLERDNVAREVIQLKSQVGEGHSKLALTQASIAQVAARKQEIIAEYRQKAAHDLTSYELSRIEAEEQVRQIKDSLSRLDVTAPSEGIVQLLSVHNVGQVVGTGDLVAEIVPSNDKLIAEVEVPADQVGFLRIGAHASIKVLTFDFTRFGIVDGTVSDISPTSFERQDGSRFFRVRLDLASENIEAGPGVGEIKPGMTVTADLYQSSKSVLSYLLKPLRVLGDRALTEP